MHVSREDMLEELAEEVWHKSPSKGCLREVSKVLCTHISRRHMLGEGPTQNPKGPAIGAPQAAPAADRGSDWGPHEAIC